MLVEVLVENARTLFVMPSGDAFAGLVGRLRLTQGEIRRLLAVDGDEGEAASMGILPQAGRDASRTASVAAALGEALELVGDDGLVGRWLRSPLPRRGGASPLQEAEAVDGDLLVRFVLRPHPTELVRLVADRPIASPQRPSRAPRRSGAHA
jgi:hypothetical protein